MSYGQRADGATADNCAPPPATITKMPNRAPDPPLSLAVYLARVYRDARVLSLSPSTLTAILANVSIVYHAGRHLISDVDCRSFFGAWRPAMGAHAALIFDYGQYNYYVFGQASGLGSREQPHFAPDGSWAEVMRADPGRFWASNPMRDGRSCNFVLGKGSGVAVNVGRSWRVRGRAELVSLLGLNLTEVFKGNVERGSRKPFPWLEFRGELARAWPTPSYEGVALDDEVGLRRRYFENDPIQLDLVVDICSHVRRLNYDSLQVWDDSCALNREQVACSISLLLCDSRCLAQQHKPRAAAAAAAHQAEGEMTCMHGLPLRTGWDLSLECHCNGTNALLNCVDNVVPATVGAPHFVSLLGVPPRSAVSFKEWCPGSRAPIDSAARAQHEWMVRRDRLTHEPSDHLCPQTTVAAHSPPAPPPAAFNGEGVAFYTAIFGGYEKTFKEPVDCNAPMFGYSDNRTQAVSRRKGSAPCWTRIIACHHRSLDVTRGLHNSIDSNRSPFNVAKFYKLNPHRLPELRPFKYVIWLDGTVAVQAPLYSPVFVDVLGNTSSVTLFEHCAPSHVVGRLNSCRHGLLLNEMQVMRSIAHEGSVYDGQDFGRQHQFYMNESGFRERWFAGALEAEGRHEYGVWVTCLVVFNLANPLTQRFLDQWWLENANTTTQDQITFVFAAWRTGLLPHSLPAHGVNGTWFKSSLHAKLDHGTR